MPSRLFNFLKQINPWHFVWIILIVTETFTAIMNVLQSYFFWGRIDRMLMIIGTIDALVVTMIAAPMTIYFLRRSHELEKINEDLEAAISARDASEHKTLLLRNALELLPIGITVSGEDGRILYVNRAEAAIHGYEVDELIGRSARDLGPQRHRKEQPVAEVDDRGVWRRETSNLRKDGSEFPVQLISLLVKDEKGMPKGFVTACEDISERAEAVRNQRRLESELLQAQKMDSIGRLAGGVAHDFNNILSAIIGYSELALFKLPKDSPAYESVKVIKDSGERAAALTHQLLAFSRKQVLTMEAVNLNAVIDNVAKMLGRIIGEDILLEFHTGSHISLVRADSRQIEQVLLNLAVNARDAMPFGGSLIVETSNVEIDQEYAKEHAATSPGPHVMLSVSDTGAGMPKEVQERIFEPFFTTKEIGKGTGLGLATVYGIVKQHNGFILVQSETGKGTTFKVCLPVAPEAQQISLVPDEANMLRGTETIMVVDDDNLVRQLIVDILHPLGYTVIEASNGQDAVVQFEHFRGTIHLLLIDVIMPGMNGRQLAEICLAKSPGTKIVYMSGYTDDVLSHHGVLEKGIVLIEKPLTPSSLASSLRAVLDAKHRAG